MGLGPGVTNIMVPSLLNHVECVNLRIGMLNLDPDLQDSIARPIHTKTSMPQIPHMSWSLNFLKVGSIEGYMWEYQRDYQGGC